MGKAKKKEPRPKPQPAPDEVWLVLSFLGIGLAEHGLGRRAEVVGPYKLMKVRRGA